MSNLEHPDQQIYNYEILEDIKRVKEDAYLDEFQEMLEEALSFINSKVADDKAVHEKFKESFNNNFTGYDLRITDVQSIAMLKSAMLLNTYKV